MNHTVSGQDYFNLRFNGTLVGETGIHAALCGTWGCPVLLVTGDDVAMRRGQASSLGDGLTTVAVKTGPRQRRRRARSRPCARATTDRGRCEAGALRPRRRSPRASPGSPCEITVEFKHTLAAGQAPLPAPASSASTTARSPSRAATWWEAWKAFYF